jgi:hypothetical protein
MRFQAGKSSNPSEKRRGRSIRPPRRFAASPRMVIAKASLCRLSPSPAPRHDSAPPGGSPCGVRRLASPPAPPRWAGHAAGKAGPVPEKGGTPILAGVEWRNRPARHRAATPSPPHCASFDARIVCAKTRIDRPVDKRRASHPLPQAAFKLASSLRQPRVPHAF